MNQDIYSADNDMYLQLLSTILERIILVENLIRSFTDSLTINEPLEVNPAILWTANKTDLIELIYAIYATGACNHGKVQIKELTNLFERLFGLQLGNTSLRFQEILRRKESTAFLSELKERLELYITRIDEKRMR